MLPGLHCPVIGLLGGVAAGKTLVAQQLARLGAGVLDADRAGHAVLEQPEVIQAIRRRWGPDVLDSRGKVDRNQLAQRVFGNKEELKHLEAITHPKIAQLLQQQARQLVQQGASALVLDAPLLLRAGWDRWCDVLVFVDAPEEVRAARAAARGWSTEQFRRREAAQEPLEEKRRRAHVVIDNSGPPERTREQVEQFWHRWQARWTPAQADAQAESPPLSS